MLSQNTDVAKAVLKVIDNYNSFALLIVKNMSANIANNLANINGIEYLTQLYMKTKTAVYIAMIRAILL